MGWIYLLLSGVLEIGFTTCMKFHTWWGVALFLLFAGGSFYMLTQAMKTIPLGTCYAVFTAIGAVGTAIVGILFFGESATGPRLALLGLIVAIVIGLKLTSSESKAAPAGR